MPRQAREDLSYFTLDCDIFSKKADLRPLLRKYKADGLAVFVHILCDVYGTGYYFKPDDYEGYLEDLAEDCGITVDKVQLILTFMADRTLLDAFSLNKNTVFTSHGIQKRYVQAMKGRKRNVAEIKGEYWLLTEKEEAQLDTFYKSHPNSNKSEKIDDKSEKIDDKSEIYSTTEQNRNKQKETEIIEDIEVSKKVSNKKEELQSYDEIFEELHCSRRLKEALLDFIRHLKASFNIVLLNDRLIGIIAELDLKYQDDDLAKCKEVRRAIVNGYKRLECEGD
ncbi:MAG: DUF4373 domain-containing protein [Clostridia bacterium]|nr:DUF4373 domain-containing protein [Clostridia bacterium]